MYNLNISIYTIISHVIIQIIFVQLSYRLCSCPIRKQLCPTLVVLMGNPDKTITSHHGHMGAPDGLRPAPGNKGDPEGAIKPSACTRNRGGGRGGEGRRCDEEEGRRGGGGAVNRRRRGRIYKSHLHTA